MTMTHPPTVRKPTEGRTIAVVGDIYRFLATGDETDGKYAMFEAIVPPDGGPPPHPHSRDVRQHASRQLALVQERHGQNRPHDYLGSACGTGEDVLGSWAAREVG